MVICTASACDATRDERLVLERVFDDKHVGVVILQARESMSVYVRMKARGDQQQRNKHEPHLLLFKVRVNAKLGWKPTKNQPKTKSRRQPYTTGVCELLFVSSMQCTTQVVPTKAMRSMVQLLRTSCTCARLPLSSTRIAKAAAVTETLAAYDEGTLVVPGGVGRRLSLSHPPMRDGHPLPPSPSLSSSSVFLLVLSSQRTGVRRCI